MDLLVILIPFVGMAFVILGLWLFVRRGRPPSPRWRGATALAVALVVLWLIFGPEDLSLTDRVLTVLPVAAFVAVVLPALSLLHRITNRQRD